MNNETDNQEQMQAVVGQLIGGKYRVDRVLGQGGMGLVVSAVHEQLDQRVALKFLLPSVVSNTDIVARFLREARAAVKIHSEHVARVFDVGQHEQLPYMVMEYLEGQDLANVISARGPLPARDAVGYVLEACDAVAEAHALGIVHRDLKPANMFLANRPSGKAVVKVLDFGISKTPVTERERAITNATAIMGSPNYMSPEQLVASASVDARSDIWSLGVVLYELFTSNLPFNANSMPELVGVILQGSYPPVGSMGVDVPVPLQEVVDKCLQKSRENRYQNVAELARALGPFASTRYESLVERIEGVLGLGSPPSSAPPATSVPRQSALGPPADHRTLAPTTSSTTKKRRPLVLLAPIAAVVVLGGLVAFVQTRARPASPALPVTLTVTEPTEPKPTASVDLIVPDPPPVSDTAVSEVVTHAHTPVGPHVSAHASASAAPPAVSTAAPANSVSSGPACKTVSYYDEQGNKHFKLDCH